MTTLTTRPSLATHTSTSSTSTVQPPHVVRRELQAAPLAQEGVGLGFDPLGVLHHRRTNLGQPVAPGSFLEQLLPERFLKGSNPAGIWKLSTPIPGRGSS